MDDEDDQVTLFIYSIPLDEYSRPTPENVYEWVQKKGVLCKGANDKYADKEPGLQFPIGHCFLFFKALRAILGMDLLDLVGTNLDSISSMTERDLICGSLPTELVGVAVLKIKYWIESYEQQQKAWEKIQNLGLDRQWFFQAFERFGAMLEESHELEGVTMGVVE